MVLARLTKDCHSANSTLEPQAEESFALFNKKFRIYFKYGIVKYLVSN